MMYRESQWLNQVGRRASVPENGEAVKMDSSLRWNDEGKGQLDSSLRCNDEERTGTRPIPTTQGDSRGDRDGRADSWGWVILITGICLGIMGVVCGYIDSVRHWELVLIVMGGGLDVWGLQRLERHDNMGQMDSSLERTGARPVPTTQGDSKGSEGRAGGAE